MIFNPILIHLFHYTMQGLKINSLNAFLPLKKQKIILIKKFLKKSRSVTKQKK